MLLERPMETLLSTFTQRKTRFQVYFGCFLECDTAGRARPLVVRILGNNGRTARGSQSWAGRPRPGAGSTGGAARVLVTLLQLPENTSLCVNVHK